MAKTVPGKKAVSKYHMINNVNRIADRLAEMAQKYSTGLATPAMAATKSAIDGLRKDPKGAVEKFSDDGRQWATDAREDLERWINQNMADGRKWARDLAEHPNQVLGSCLAGGKVWSGRVFAQSADIVEEIAEDGKTLAAEIRSDPEAVVRGIVRAGKTYARRIPGVQAIDTQIADKKNAIVDALNLSTRDDIKDLAATIEKLSQKISRLSSRMKE